MGEVTDQVTTATIATIATVSEKHNSNHLSVHQWIRFAIRDSQQPTSPIGFLFLKLPPPPCAVLLVIFYLCLMHYMIVCIHYMDGWKDGWKEGRMDQCIILSPKLGYRLTRWRQVAIALHEVVPMVRFRWNTSGLKLWCGFCWTNHRKCMTCEGFSPGILDQWMLHEDTHR